MKKAVCTVLVFILTLLINLPVSAQKSKTVRPAERVNSDAVKFHAAGAFSDGRGVWIGWEMERETNNLGFYVSRVDQNGKRLAAPNLVVSSAGKRTAYGEKYSFFDTAGRVESGYIIESLQNDGERISTGIIYPQYIGDLKEIAGLSSQEFAEAAANATGNIETSELKPPKGLLEDITVNQTSADLNTHRWVVAQQGVRIGVKKDGMHRVSRNELQAAGFDVNINSGLWQLYLEGVEQSILIGPGDSYIEFFGKGIDTPETDTRMYFLIGGHATGKRIQSTFIRRIASTVVSPSYNQTFIKKERNSYVYDILNGDLDNYWGRTISPTTATISFTLTGVDFTKPNSSLRLDLHGFSTAAHSVAVVINGNSLNPITGNGRTPFSQVYNILTSYLNEGSNTLQLTSQSAGDTSMFDTLSIGYARKHLSDQNKLAFYTDNYRGANLGGFSTQNVRVFETTREGAPDLITNASVRQNGATYDVILPVNRARLFYAVEDSGLFQAASITRNNPSTLSTPANVGTLLIIAYHDLMPQAEDWANYRRGQGFSVKVVDVDDVYDEFNFGIFSAAPISSFLNYAKNNWQTPPQYVLLIGDGSFDSRNYEGRGYQNQVPPKMVNTVYTETGSDEGLADFDGDGLAEMAIGRIPAQNGQTVTTILNKTIAFENGLGVAPLNRGVIFAFDYPDGYDFQGMSERLRALLPASIPAPMIFRGDANAQATLISEINNGRYIVNYAGHGTTGSWANPSFFSVVQVPQLTNANANLSIFTMLTCLNGYFINPYNDSMAEVLLKSPTGGASVAWASTGLTTPYNQEIMATRFFQQVAAGNITRMGDLVRDAKTTIPGGQDVRLSWALIGDPMLKVR